MMNEIFVIVKHVTYTPVMLLQDYSIISEDGQMGADHLLGLH